MNQFTLSEQSNQTEEELKKPNRYIGGDGLEVFDIINSFGLDYYEGNVLKYLLRYKKKGGLTDLKKARVYLDYMIEGYKQ